MIKGCVMKKMDSAPRSPLSRTSVPLYQPHGRYVLPSRKAPPARSVTRAEIDHFWMRKKLEEEEHQLAAEKEARTSKWRQLSPGTLRYELASRIGTLPSPDDNHYFFMLSTVALWRKSSYAYLNEPVVTCMDENSTWKDTMANISQNIYFGRCSPAPHQTNTTAFGIFEVMMPRLM